MTQQEKKTVWGNVLWLVLSFAFAVVLFILVLPDVHDRGYTLFGEVIRSMPPYFAMTFTITMFFEMGRSRSWRKPCRPLRHGALTLGLTAVLTWLLPRVCGTAESALTVRRIVAWIGTLAALGIVAFDNARAGLAERMKEKNK